MLYSHCPFMRANKVEVAKFNGLGGDTFPRIMTDAQMHGQMDGGPTLLRNYTTLKAKFKK